MTLDNRGESGSARVIVLILLTASLTLLLALGTFHYLDTPVPEGLEEVWKYRIVEASLKTAVNIIKFTTTIGLSTGTDWLAQTTFDTFLSVITTGSPFGVGHQPELNIYNTKFNGVNVRVYEPINLKSEKRPALVYIHGGGWTWEEPGKNLHRLSPFAKGYDMLTVEYAKQANVVVFSIGYRKAPQYRHPVAYEDCLSAASYIIDKATTLRIDPSRVGIGGDGAGGHLTAAVSLQLKKKLRLQMLFYPCLQAFDFRNPSYLENTIYLSNLMSQTGMIQFWMNYGNFSYEHIDKFRQNQHTSAALKKSKYAKYVSSEFYIKDHIRNKHLIDSEVHQGGDEALSKSIEKTILDKRFSPLLADDSDYKDLPLTYVLAVGYDVLREDGIIYSQRLKKAGVDVHLSHFPDAFHIGIMFFKGPFSFDVSKRINEDIVEFLQKNL